MNAACRKEPLIDENLCAVISNEAVNAEYRLLLAQAPDLALTARPGQFFHLLCPDDGGGRLMLRRPMSIYRIDADNRQIGFLYKVTGRGTRGLAMLRPGDTLNALGPLGHGFALPPATSHVLLVARGVGLATLTPLARHAVAAGARVTAVLSARTPALILSETELRDAGARVIVVTDQDGSSDPAGLAARLDRMQADDPFDYAATCGSNRLFRLVRDFCGARRIPGQIALEARMACGTGMCFACVAPIIDPDGTVSYHRVCWDGPVFSVTEATGW